MRREPTNKWAAKATKPTRSGHEGKHAHAWRALSRNLRANHPMCQVCNVKPSTEVHHRVRWVDSELHRLDPRSCVCVCRPCHELLEKHCAKA